MTALTAARPGENSILSCKGTRLYPRRANESYIRLEFKRWRMCRISGMIVSYTSWTCWMGTP